jgi:hypothetical protein
VTTAEAVSVSDCLVVLVLTGALGKIKARPREDTGNTRGITDLVNVNLSRVVDYSTISSPLFVGCLVSTQ